MHAVDQLSAIFYGLNRFIWQGWVPSAKRTGRSRKIHIFERQLGSSITRHRGGFPENLALQYPGTMRPHYCASWLKCPSYMAPGEPARSRQSV